MKRRAFSWVLVALVATIASAVHAAPNEPELPPIQRRIPEHPVSLLNGCSAQDRAVIERQIEAAIQLGAPIYNQGDFRGCYETYERAARAIEAALSPTCSGPAQALRDGRNTASARPNDAAKAWAMRDTFDGLLIVLDRVRR
ncbi:MAG: hypothetical protein AB7S26_22040 [Sandaracinaceae bacterium]